MNVGVVTFVLLTVGLPIYIFDLVFILSFRSFLHGGNSHRSVLFIVCVWAAVIVECCTRCIPLRKGVEVVV